jgi:hypothetical protein
MDPLVELELRISRENRESVSQERTLANSLLTASTQLKALRDENRALKEALAQAQSERDTHLSALTSLHLKPSTPLKRTGNDSKPSPTHVVVVDNRALRDLEKELQSVKKKGAADRINIIILI